jgi:hypothetical protein
MGRLSLLSICLLAGCLLTPELELVKAGARIRTPVPGEYHVSLRGKRAPGWHRRFAANVGQGHGDLVELNLSASRVTDKDLKDLIQDADRLQKLRRLDLRSTSVSSETIDEVQAAIPNCEIIRPTAGMGGVR